MNILRYLVLAAVAVFAFAAAISGKSVGRPECGGRCFGCGKCGRGRKLPSDGARHGAQ